MLTPYFKVKLIVKAKVFYLKILKEYLNVYSTFPIFHFLNIYLINPTRKRLFPHCSNISLTILWFPTIALAAVTP